MSSRVALTALLGSLLAACAALFEEPIQCKTDEDCVKFSGSICGASGTCEAANGAPGSGSITPGGGPAAGEDGGVVIDPQTGQPVIGGDGGPSPGVACPSLETRTATPFPGVVAGGTGEILANTNLTCTMTYELTGVVVVRSTLTIGAGTWIKGSTGAQLVIAPGGKIVAEGTKDIPIVFTSAAGTPAAGDWVGIHLAGKAPPERTVLGETIGGNVDNDSSGSLKFVRIEYAQRGLELSSVGSGTMVDSVQVRKTNDNCFTINGGRVDLKRLVCQYPADEMFEFTNGYQGRAQFLVGQRTPLASAGAHGLLLDNAALTMANATLCGSDAPSLGNGLLLRTNAAPAIQNIIVRGFGAGFDVANARGTPFELKSSVFQGNHTENIAYAEDAAETNMASPLFNDDADFDERAFFADAVRKNVETDPGLGTCFDPNNPGFAPAAQIPGDAPPAEPFFEQGSFKGAVSTSAQDWTKAPWLRWSDK